MLERSDCKYMIIEFELAHACSNERVLVNEWITTVAQKVT